MCLTSNVTTPVHDARGGSVRASNGRKLVLRTSVENRKEGEEGTHVSS